ncbi:MAG TPA: AAA family ATPase [Methylocella sp.]|nr:AAA family ATPase [Methylocella sp.]
MKKGCLIFADFRVDRAGALLWHGHERIPLAPKPFEVLCQLIDRPGELVTKNELLQAVWPNLHVSDSSLSVAINGLRMALGDDSNDPRYIETVTRRGYRFIAPVTVASPSEDEPRTDQRRLVLCSEASPPQRWRVGRANQIETLEGIFQQVLSANRQVIFITGEAGIGKTTLVEMLLERPICRGVGVLWGRCIEQFGTNEAFLPLIEALQECCRERSGDLFLKKLRERAPTWLAQMPGLLDAKERASLQSEIFGTTRERMLREFCELIEAVSSDHPLILVIEDLHWGDFATLDALSLFARRRQKASVLVLATYRPSDVMMGKHPIRLVHQELQIHGCSKELALDRFSLGEVEEYLEARFNDAGLTQVLVPQVFKRTEGQPLFLASLVNYFVAKKEMFQVDGRWHLASKEVVSGNDIPLNLREMITCQIDRLNVDDQRLLEAASAIGTEFSAAAVAAAVDRDLSDVELACKDLVRKVQFIACAGVAEWQDGTVAASYAFRHALYQELLYQRLAPGQRIQLHRRLGERLEEGYGSRSMEIAPVLALHFEQGREFAKALRYLQVGAEHSAKRFANQEAANYLTRALNLVDRLPDHDQKVRIQLLQQRGWVRRSAGDMIGSLDDLKEMIVCAEENRETRLEVSGLLDLSRFYLYADRKECIELAERAVSKSWGLNDTIFSGLIEGNRANLGLYLKGWRSEDAEICRNSVKLTAEEQDLTILMRRCSIECILEYLTSDYRACCAAAARGQNFAKAAGEVYLYVLYNLVESFALLHLGEWKRLKQNTAAALAITEKNENFAARVLCHLTIGWLHAEAMDFEKARLYCEEALTPSTEMNPFVFFLGRTLLAKVYLGLQNYPLALAQFETIQRRIDTGIDMDCTIRPQFHYNLFGYWLEVGDLDRAQDQAIRLFEITVQPPERTYLALSHESLAKIALAEGDPEKARTQVSQAVEIVDNFTLPLAAWRVYATASAIHEFAGDTKKAAMFKVKSEKTIKRLENSLEEDCSLRSTLVAGFSAFRARRTINRYL